jgi:hypothetical protein
MGGLGSAMISRRALAAAGVFLALALGVADARAGGFDVGCEIVSVDVAGTLTRVPVALRGAFDEILAMLADQGVPPVELADIEADFDSALADLNANLDAFPTLLPLPLLGGGIEFSVPWVVIDGVRLSGGILNGAIVRGLAAMGGVEVPDPLFADEFDLDGETASFTVDADMSAWAISVEAVKRLDIVVVAINLSAGVDFLGGSATIQVDRQVPPEWIGGVDAALGALHLDDVRWSAVAGHLGLGLEVGFPFLRLTAGVRLLQPFAQSSGWWDLRVGGLAGSVGVVIRF